MYRRLYRSAALFKIMITPKMVTDNYDSALLSLNLFRRTSVVPFSGYILVLEDVVLGQVVAKAFETGLIFCEVFDRPRHGPGEFPYHVFDFVLTFVTDHMPKRIFSGP